MFLVRSGSVVVAVVVVVPLLLVLVVELAVLCVRCELVFIVDTIC